MEQVELRQVFAYTSTGATRAMTSLNSGKPFEDVAYEYDWVAGGYLGWVPRGYLLILPWKMWLSIWPVGSYSDIITSDIGYHIVMVLDRGERALSPDALQVLQREALQKWVADRLATSTIEILGNLIWVKRRLQETSANQPVQCAKISTQYGDTAPTSAAEKVVEWGDLSL